MHSLSFLSAIYSTINLCTGPFFLKVISQNIIQCLFSSTIALQVFQSLKQNEDKSRDLGKGEKSILQQIWEGYMRQQEVQGTRFCIQRSKISEKEKERIGRPKVCRHRLSHLLLGKHMDFWFSIW